MPKTIEYERKYMDAILDEMIWNNVTKEYTSDAGVVHLVTGDFFD